MKKLSAALCGMVMTVLSMLSAPAQAQSNGEQSAGAAEPRELIYCADLMTHDERETYRARMRAARTPQDKAALRQAHRQDMQARARERGVDTLQCEPLQQRQRRRGGVSP
jgi:hypothetical protein